MGETCQRYSPDGTKYYAEQISHHPPISAAVMEGSDDAWKLEVIQEFKASLNGHNSIMASKSGALVITLGDGTQYVVDDPQLCINGLLYGDLVYNIIGTTVIRDITNEITSEVVWDPDNQEGYISSFASKLKFWGSKKAKRPSDNFDINIFQGEVDKKNIVCQGTGCYLHYVEFGEEKYWEMGEPWGDWKIPEDGTLLPSDSSHRADRNYIAVKDYKSAQASKEELENKQRADKKLREKAKKKSKK